MTPVNIVFLIFPKTHLFDLSGVAQVFYEANNHGKDRFKLHFASLTKTLISEQGLIFSNLISLEDLKLKKGDMVCIPGIEFVSFTNGDMDEFIEATKEWLRIQYNNGVYLSSVCSGALLLAEMGFLDGLKCTTHWKCLAYAKKQYPKAHFNVGNLYRFDKNIFTSAGMTAGIDMALALIEQWVSPLLAARVAQEMVINIRRSDTKNQKNVFLDFKNHFNESVYNAQEILANRLDSSFTIKDLATELRMGERQLCRLFKSHTNNTIQFYRENLRLEHGQKLLYNTELSVKEVSLQCGFESSRQLTRLWKKKIGISPIEDRRNFISNSKHC